MVLARSIVQIVISFPIRSRHSASNRRYLARLIVLFLSNMTIQAASSLKGLWITGQNFDPSLNKLNFKHLPLIVDPRLYQFFPEASAPIGQRQHVGLSVSLTQEICIHLPLLDPQAHARKTHPVLSSMLLSLPRRDQKSMIFAKILSLLV